MRTFYRHGVSTAQYYRCNHGDDAMPDGGCVITTCEVDEDRDIGRESAADGAFHARIFRLAGTVVEQEDQSKTQSMWWNGGLTWANRCVLLSIGKTARCTLSSPMYPYSFLSQLISSQVSFAGSAGGSRAFIDPKECVAVTF